MHHTPPPPPVGEMQRVVAEELSRSARTWHFVLLFVAMIMVAVLSALWITETGLPRRTQIAFGALIVAGGSWIAHALRVLTTRRVPFEAHRVVAARMAVNFSLAFFCGSAMLNLLAPAGSGRFRFASWTATGMGALMCVVAIALLRKSRRRLAALQARRAAIEQRLGQDS